MRPTPSSLTQRDVRLVDAALVDEVLHEAAHRVVDEGRDHRRVQAEAALEAAGDVVFAAAFPDLERARGVDAALARDRGAASPRPGSRRSQRQADLSLMARAWGRQV